MQFLLAKDRFKIFDLIVGLIFLSLSSYVFYVYSIDYSVLIVFIIIAIYLNFIRKVNTVPFLDLCLLATLAIVTNITFSLFFKKEAFLISIIAFSLLTTLLFSDFEFSVVFCIFVVLLSIAVKRENFSLNFGVSLFSAAFISSLFSLNIRRRFQITKAALLGGLVYWFNILFLERKVSFNLFLIFDSLKISLLDGFVASIVVIGILPIFEFIFRVITNISLLELSDFNHPLLKKLVFEAPGTYQHSLVVANLSEAAAEAIGANSLLARVGAYYHDIGKLTKPNYFVENVVGYKDVHKDLKPSISKLIIINHVKEGIELARKYHLHPKIIDFIIQHHGRSLVYYFYQKAKELESNLNLNAEQLKEEYRYPGPKPQSPEVAIVSLADTIEALSRTLDEPTPSRIKEMVEDVIRKRFMEGELDESNLTLKDLEKISQSFVRILNAIFHTRINYPKDEDRNSKSAKDKEDKS